MYSRGCYLWCAVVYVSHGCAVVLLRIGGLSGEGECCLTRVFNCLVQGVVSQRYAVSHMSVVHTGVLSRADVLFRRCVLFPRYHPAGGRGDPIESTAPVPETRMYDRAHLCETTQSQSQDTRQLKCSISLEKKYLCHRIGYSLTSNVWSGSSNWFEHMNFLGFCGITRLRN